MHNYITAIVCQHALFAESPKYDMKHCDVMLLVFTIIVQYNAPSDSDITKSDSNNNSLLLVVGVVCSMH